MGVIFFHQWTLFFSQLSEGGPVVLARRAFAAEEVLVLQVPPTIVSGFDLVCLDNLDVKH